jgi:hypothetical protein
MVSRLFYSSFSALVLGIVEIGLVYESAFGDLENEIYEAARSDPTLEAFIASL